MPEFMSRNQSRADKSNNRLSKSGRSGNSGQQWVLIRGGGRKGGGGGSSLPPSTSFSSSSIPSTHSSLSNNPSFKNSGDGQGAQSPVHGSLVAQDQGVGKTVDSSALKNFGSLPRPPSSQPYPGVSDSGAPATPAKEPAENSSKEFTLQFGSISPGFFNGTQSHHDSSRAVPTLPISSDSQPLLPQMRKDVFDISQSNAGDSQHVGQAKKDRCIQIPAATSGAAQMSSVLPSTGMSMPLSFQQAQVHVQLSGPSTHMQSQGILTNSLQILMPLPMGNAQSVQQQLFVPSLQSHPFQPQGMLHQGQGLSFAPQMGHQMGSQMGNLGIGPQFIHQQNVKFGGSRKPTVIITHPETHEELRVNKRTGSFSDAGSSNQKPHLNITPHPQHISSFTPIHQINHYPPLQPNPASIFLHTPTSLMPTTTQMMTGSHTARYNHLFGQSEPIVTCMNPSLLNPLPVRIDAPPMHNVSVPPIIGHSGDIHALPVSAPSAPLQVIVKPASDSFVEKVDVASVTVSMPIKNYGTVEQREREICSERSVLLSKPVPEPSGTILLPTTEKLSTSVPDVALVQTMELCTSSSAPPSNIGDLGHIVSSTDGRKTEPIRKSDSLKIEQKQRSKKDLRHSQQKHQADASDSVGASKLHSLKISEDSCSYGLNAREISKSYENIRADSGAIDPSHSLLRPPTQNFGQTITSDVIVSKTENGGPIPASSDSSAVKLEEGASQDFPVGCSKKSTFSGVEEDATESRNFAATPCLEQADHTSLEVGQKQILGTEECQKTLVCDDSLQESSSFIPTVSTNAESSAGIKGNEVVLQEGTTTYNLEKAMPDVSINGESDLISSIGERLSCSAEANIIVEEFVASSTHLSSKVIHQGKVSISSQVAALPNYRLSSIVNEPIPASESFETTHISEGKVKEISGGSPVSTLLPVLQDKPSLESTRAKTTAGKKKKEDILLKADASETNSDIYAEKSETAMTSASMDNSSTIDVKHVPVDETQKNVAKEEDGQSKSELDNWEAAFKISTLKLRTPENGQHGHAAKKLGDAHGSRTTSKSYCRDFLLTFSDQCTVLPVGFKIGSDMVDALMSVQIGMPHLSDREPFPSPGRITARSTGAIRVDRRVVGIVDVDKWTKAPGPFALGRDLRLDAGRRPAIVSIHTGQGVNHGVLRNPHGQSNQHVGGIHLGSLQSLTSHGGTPQSNADADRWQRAAGIQRGLIPSPQTPLQVMHKAERKYELGKVTDKEAAKQRQLKAILNKLTPQNFEKLFEQVKEVNIDNIVTLTGVISQIFDKALMEPTFCEMYANFCFHLASQLPDFNVDNQKITFKRLLLNKCQEEFERGDREQAEANKVEAEGEIKRSAEEREGKRLQARRRMLGNIRLIGELYKKKMLTEGIMHECIKKLLGQHQNPDEEDVEALCKLMSTIGEIIDHPKAREHMDAYFDMMFKLSTNHKLSSRVRFMLKDAIDLRKNKWQQRRKVEGPKKIEEVHRDAALERHAQSSRLVRGPGIGSSARRGNTY